MTWKNFVQRKLIATAKADSYARAIISDTLIRERHTARALRDERLVRA